MKLLVLIPLILIGILPIASAEAPDYKLTFNIKDDWGVKSISSVSVEKDGVSVSGRIIDSCIAGSKYSTTCEIIIIMQNEKIIDQNNQIIKLLTEIKNK